MAPRGSHKWLSLRQEEFVARAYGAERDPSSGAGTATKGDVIQRRSVTSPLPEQLFECKHRGTFDKPAKSISLSLKDFEKIRDAAISEGREPVMQFRLYAPDSSLANHDGMVDFTVRLTAQDVVRDYLLNRSFDG